MYPCYVGFALQVYISNKTLNIITSPFMDIKLAKNNTFYGEYYRIPHGIL